MIRKKSYFQGITFIFKIISSEYVHFLVISKAADIFLFTCVVYKISSINPSLSIIFIFKFKTKYSFFSTFRQIFYLNLKFK